MKQWEQEQKDQAKEAKVKAVKKPRKRAALNPPRKKEQAEDKLETGYKFTRNQQNFLDALRESRAIISKAAHISGLHRNNHVVWCRKYPEYKEEYETILDESIDVVEDQLLENISQGDTTAIIFYLKCKAKKRGYVDRTEVEISGELTRYNVGFKKEDSGD